MAFAACVGFLLVHILDIDIQPTLALSYLSFSYPAAGSVVCGVVLNNTGNMRLDNVTILGDSTDCKISLLEPNKLARCSMWRSLTQDDFDAGFVTVNATGASAAPRGPVSALPKTSGDAATVALNQTATMDLSVKTDKANVTSATDSVNVTFIAGNTGSVTLRNASFNITPALSSTSCSGSNGSLDMVTGTGSSVQITRLNVSQYFTCTGALLFDQDTFEADKRSIKVTGTASAHNLTADALSQQPDVTPLNFPKLSVLMNSNCSTPDAAGGNVTCPVGVQNVGNVRVANISIMGQSLCTNKVVAPGELVQCNVTKKVTQDDFEAAVAGGQVVVIANVTGMPRGAGAFAGLMSNSTKVTLRVQRSLSATAVANATNATVAGKAFKGHSLCSNHT